MYAQVAFSNKHPWPFSSLILIFYQADIPSQLQSVDGVSRIMKNRNTLWKAYYLCKYKATYDY